MIGIDVVRCAAVSMSTTPTPGLVGRLLWRLRRRAVMRHVGTVLLMASESGVITVEQMRLCAGLSDILLDRKTGRGKERFRWGP